MEEQAYHVVSDFPRISAQCKTSGKSLYFHVTDKIAFIRWVDPFHLITCVEKPSGDDINHVLFYYQLNPARLLAIYDFATPIRDLITLPLLNKRQDQQIVQRTTQQPPQQQSAAKQKNYEQFVFITPTSLNVFNPIEVPKVITPYPTTIPLPLSPICLSAHPKLPFLFVGCIDGTVVVINHSMQILSLIKTHNAPIIKAIPSTDVPHAFVCCARGPSMIKIQSLLTGQSLNTLPLHIFMTDLSWAGDSDSPIIIGDSFGFVSMIDRRCVSKKSKKQATFTRIKVHKGGCNAVDSVGTVVFSAGDDGTAVVFDKQKFDLKRKRGGFKELRVLVKTVERSDGVIEVMEDVDVEQDLDSYVLLDDKRRVVDIKYNASLKIVAIAVRKGLVILKRLNC